MRLDRNGLLARRNLLASARGSRSQRLTRPPRGAPRLEPLEDRTLLSVSMVKDLNVAPQSSRPSGFVQVNGTMFFLADDPLHGRELWKTDGTTTGTTLVKDIFPGPRDSSQPAFPTILAALNGRVYFAAFEPVNGLTLWSSDGTAAGTGPVSGLPTTFFEAGLTSLDGALYFNGFDSSNQPQVWRSDGTAAGTVQLTTGPGHAADRLTDLNGTVYFLDKPSFATAASLWKTDGTPAGTAQVDAFAGGVAELTRSGGSLYMVADDGGGTGLWSSDGTTAGTSLVYRTPGFGASDLTDFNGTLVFEGVDAGGAELWRSDGTAGGTSVIDPASAGGPSSPGQLTAVGNTLYFTGDAGADLSLWKSDGTAAGTSALADFESGAEPGGGPAYLTGSGGTLYFANDAGLWSSDGTSAGTVLLHAAGPVFASPGPFQHTPPPEPGVYEGVSDLTAFNGGVLFAGTDPATGKELWFSNGTAAGTALVKDINPGTQDTNFFGLAAGNGKLFFQVQTPDDPADRDPTDAGTYALWVSNGTDRGTVALADFGQNAADLSSTAVVDGTFYFVAYDPVGNGTALWASDGTAAGTRMVLDPNPGGSTAVSSLTAVGDQLFFVASDGTDGYELWHSDGTTAGTAMVADINPTGDSSPSNLTAVGGAVYFSADDGVNGPQLWKSDGTAAGTTLVAVIQPGGTNLHDFAAFGGRLYFGASDGVHGDQLWKSNGTAAGTKMVAVINPGGDATPQNLVNAGGTLFFTADDGVNGRQLWESNGTPRGTQLVTVINAGGDPGIHGLTAVHGKLFFVATDGTNPDAVWTSDGTAAGTVELTGPSLNLVDNGIAGVQGTAFFAGYTAGAGYQLWASDGTPAGTLAVQLLTPAFNPAPFAQGFPNLAPGDLTAAGGILYFDANDLTHGRELWKAVPPQARLSGPASGTANQSLSYTLGAVEPSVHDPSAVYTFTVNWGDGTTGTFTGTAGTTATHAFASAGTYFVILTTVDQTGIGSLPVKETVTITAPPLQASVLVAGSTAFPARLTSGTAPGGPAANASVRDGADWLFAYLGSESADMAAGLAPADKVTRPASD